MPTPPLSWDDLQLFLAIAEAGSLGRAAQRLGATQPTLSRRLAELERRFGEPLFVRSVGGTHLTSFGESLLGPTRRMAECAADAERVAERREISPRGVVRVTCAPGVAWEFVAPFAALAREALPDVQLEVLAQIRYLDLSRREADLALRAERPRARDVEVLVSLAVEAGAFVAPGLAKRLPRRPKLTDVSWLGWAPPFQELSPNRELAAAGIAPVFTADDFLVQLRAAEAGVGAVWLGRVAHRFTERALVELHGDWPTPRSELHLVASRAALAIPRVRAVADLLVAELRGVKALPRAKAR